MTSNTAAGIDAAINESQSRIKRTAALVAAVLLVIGYAGFHVGLFDAERISQGIPDIIDLFAESLPPNFSSWQDWMDPLLDTLMMSIAGTAMAVLISVPLGILGASNTSPNQVVYRIARVIMNTLRSVPELIMGIIFVAAVGFGALPGVLALGFHSVGMVAKFIAEAIEHVDEGPVEATRAAGASRLQAITHGVIPQVLPQIADVTIYRWEYNFRASTVMGMVGAGGIGFELMSSLRLMQYQEVMAILLVILLMVTLVDGIGAQFRRRFK